MSHELNNQFYLIGYGRIGIFREIIHVVIYWVDITLVHFLALWSFLALQFLIYSAVQSDFWPSGFLFIQPSRKGHWTSPSLQEREDCQKQKKMLFVVFQNLLAKPVKRWIFA